MSNQIKRPAALEKALGAPRGHALGTVLEDKLGLALGETLGTALGDELGRPLGLALGPAPSDYLPMSSVHRRAMSSDC